tara:strand:- start:3874 stop:4197 length:324 start_codon:yes stop_codon:yes gene_type:complete
MIKKNNKYGAVKTTVDGIVFDSKREAVRYMELMVLQKNGQISRLELQPKYDCIINGKKICTYRADFRYFTKDRRIVEDVKGVKTPVYILKKKLVEALYAGVIIQEIK